MDFAGLNLVELNEGVAKAANFNTNIADRGVLTTSWNGEATANDVLFSLTFTATTNGLLSELIAVNSDLTVAEAYNNACLLYTSPSPRDLSTSRMPSSA